MANGTCLATGPRVTKNSAEELTAVLIGPLSDSLTYFEDATISALHSPEETVSFQHIM